MRYRNRAFAAANGLGGDDAILKIKCSVSRSLKPLQPQTEFTMNTYVAIINGKAVLVFRAEDDDEARSIIGEEGGSMRSDLRALAGMDGKVAMGREVRQ